MKKFAIAIVALFALAMTVEACPPTIIVGQSSGCYSAPAIVQPSCYSAPAFQQFQSYAVQSYVQPVYQQKVFVQPVQSYGYAQQFQVKKFAVQSYGYSQPVLGIGGQKVFQQTTIKKGIFPFRKNVKQTLIIN